MPTSGSSGVSLSDREVGILRLLAEGHDKSVMANELYISENTIKTHLSRIYQKIGAVNAAHAVAIAFRAGILS